MTRSPGLAAALVAAALFAAGCGEDETTFAGAGPSSGTPVPDFSVRDVNPNSDRHDEMVSPRDYLTRVSAWYFGHAT